MLFFKQDSTELKEDQSAEKEANKSDQKSLKKAKGSNCYFLTEVSPLFTNF